jgi:hypothetical protein
LKLEKQNGIELIMTLSAEQITTWYPIGICAFSCFINFSMIAVTHRFYEKPKWVKLYSFIFILGHFAAIVAVGKLWEGLDICMHFSRLNGLVFGLSMMFLVYFLPLFFSAILIKAFFPNVWQRCQDFYNKKGRT